EKAYICDYWTIQFPQIKSSAATINALDARFNDLTDNTRLRNILGSYDSEIDFDEILDDRKILIVNLAIGSLGSGPCDVIGNIMVSQLRLAALRRAPRPASTY